jgi:protoheme IX farnesyltransferase
MFKDYIELSKPRILVMQVVTLGMGIFLAADSLLSWGAVITSVIGTMLVSAGAGAFNHALEAEVDLLMARTQSRPVAAGRISKKRAFLFGSACLLIGFFLLFVFVNTLVGVLSFLTVVMYVSIYTPMKQMSWLNTLVGAIPGAIPPLGGWATVRGDLSSEAWVLFLILFVWQLPHFYAIAWIFKEDYTRGGFKMLSVMDETGTRTARQIVMQTILLIIVALFPLSVGMAGMVYGVGSVILGGYFLKCGFRFYRSRSVADARGVLRASVLYLPLLLVLMVVDRLVL